MEKVFFGHSKSSGIYQILNKINNKRYFGQAKQLASRAYQHEAALKSNRHGNKHLQAAWNLHGPEAFEFTVIAVIDDPEQRTHIEQKLIDAFYGEDCYNIEKKAQLMPEEVCEKLSRAGIGRPSPNKGKTASEATKQKMSETRRGKKRGPMSEEQKQKLREINTGKTASEATKQKLSEMRRGRTPHNKGKPHSEETKQKLREAHTGRTLSEEHKQKIKEAHLRRFAALKELSESSSGSSLTQ